MKHTESIYATVVSLSFIVMGINPFVSLRSLFGEGESISFKIFEDEYMRSVSKDVRNIWKNGDYLVVAGIPSIDNDERFIRRNLQRETC